MYKIDTPSAGVGNTFKEGDDPTEITTHWLDAVQNEIATVIEGAGIALDPTNTGQLLTAVTQMAGRRTSELAALPTPRMESIEIHDSKRYSLTINHDLNPDCCGAIIETVILKDAATGSGRVEHFAEFISFKDTFNKTIINYNGIPALEAHFSNNTSPSLRLKSSDRMIDPHTILYINYIKLKKSDYV